ncbi:MAG: NrsF family protein [Luteimonas sp.]
MIEPLALIDQLASRATPVRPLASPLKRAALWSLAAIALIALVTASYGLRPGVLAELSAAPKALEWLASVLTGLLAAYAAFQVSVPGRSRSWAWLPVLPMLLWLGGFCWGCLRDFATLGDTAFAYQSGSWECARAITAISLPLGFLLLMMVRHAGVVRPGPTALLAALSAAALSAAGVSLFHDGENTLMVLLWHLGAVVVLSLACWAGGQRLFAWIGHARN